MRIREIVENKNKKDDNKARNYVAKNMHVTTSGSGAHKDKKAAQKRGETKHKKPFEALEETATAGATSSGNIATVVSPHVAIGKDRTNKSYTGVPGQSGKKAPAVPKVTQPKNKNGTAKNALDIGTSLFGGTGSIKR